MDFFFFLRAQFGRLLRKKKSSKSVLLKGSEHCLQGPYGLMLSPTWPKPFSFFDNQKARRKDTEKKNKKPQAFLPFILQPCWHQLAAHIHHPELPSWERKPPQSYYCNDPDFQVNLDRYQWAANELAAASQSENSRSMVWRLPSNGIFKQSISLTSNYLSGRSRKEEHLTF